MNYFFKYCDILIIYFYNIYYYFKNDENENIHDNINSESLYIKNEDIEILKIESKNYTDWDKTNIKKYLDHHILMSDNIFNKQFFDEPIYVKFKYLGETYKICLKNLEHTNEAHDDIKKMPVILSATIKNDDIEIDVTEIIKEYHGNTKNFFNHIPDVISDLSYLLEHDGELHIYDMLGNINKYMLKN